MELKGERVEEAMFFSDSDTLVLLTNCNFPNVTSLSQSRKHGRVVQRYVRRQWRFRFRKPRILLSVWYSVAMVTAVRFPTRLQVKITEEPRGGALRMDKQ